MGTIKKATIVIAILISILTISALAESFGTVTTDVLNLREGASTGNRIIGKLYRGSIVNVIEQVNSEWVKVNANGSVGFVAKAYLSIRTTETTSRSIAPTQTGTQINQNGFINTSALNFRVSPNVNAEIIKVLSNNEAVYVLETMDNGWSKISSGGKTGYAATEFIKLGQSPTPMSNGAQIVQYAKQFLGKPYVYGATGPYSFDCSGFTKYVFQKFGINLNRTTYEQVKQGVYVDKSSLQAGDLIFFKYGSRGVNHVGIYVGDGQIIHASSPGDVVKFSTINSGYYSTNYYTARRFN